MSFASVSQFCVRARSSGAVHPCARAGPSCSRPEAKSTLAIPPATPTLRTLTATPRNRSSRELRLNGIGGSLCHDRTTLEQPFRGCGFAGTSKLAGFRGPGEVPRGGELQPGRRSLRTTGPPVRAPSHRYSEGRSYCKRTDPRKNAITTEVITVTRPGSMKL